MGGLFPTYCVYGLRCNPYKVRNSIQKFNIDYLMQHISYELHTIVKNWTDTLSSQTKPEVVCARKDISDEYLPFSVFTDSILNAEDTFNLASSTLIFSVGTADQQIFTHMLLPERNICSLDL